MGIERAEERGGYGELAPMVQNVDLIGDRDVCGFKLAEGRRDPPVGQIVAWIIVEAHHE